MAEQIDSGALKPEQLSPDEIKAILGIESRIREAQAATHEFTDHEYLFKAQDRHARVLLLDGGRGTGKTALLVTMADWWNQKPAKQVETNKVRKSAFEDKLELPHVGKHATEDREVDPPPGRPKSAPILEIPEHVQVLSMLDFDPIPPQMPLLAGIIQAVRPLAEFYEKTLSHRAPDDPDDDGGQIMDLWHQMFRMAAAGWTSVPTNNGLIEQVLDRQEQVSDWQRLDSHWQEFFDHLFVAGKNLELADRPDEKQVFVIMIDDVDLQVERIRELLPALRLLYHPRVFFVVAADSNHMEDMLKLDFFGKEQELAHYQSVGNPVVDGSKDRWALALAKSAFEKVFALSNRYRVSQLTLNGFLEYSDKSEGTPDLRQILDQWPRQQDASEETLGGYLGQFVVSDGGSSPLERFLPYRRAHRILRHAIDLGGATKGGAQDIIRNVIGRSEADTLMRLTHRKLRRADPHETEGLEYLASGTLSAEFSIEFENEIDHGGSIILSSRPDIIFRDSSTEIASSAINSPDNDPVLSAIVAVSLQDDHYGVVAPAIRWNIRRAIAWTNVHVYEYLDNTGLPVKNETAARETAVKYPEMTFRWQLHEHPSPLRLLSWANDWAEYVRSLPASVEDIEERIAYAFVYYQLRWLKAIEAAPAGGNGPPPAPDTGDAHEASDAGEVEGDKGVPPSSNWETDLDPLKTGDQWDSTKENLWDRLLALKPTAGNEHEIERWHTRTLPLLARPELGLPTELHKRFLKWIDPQEGDFGGEEETTEEKLKLFKAHEWLRTQRLRRITDAILAANGDVRDAESEGNVTRVRDTFNGRFFAGNDSTESEWFQFIEKSYLA